MIRWKWGSLRMRRPRCFSICEFENVDARDIAKDTNDSTASTKISHTPAGV